MALQSSCYCGACTDVYISLRLGSVAPNFKALTTQGEIDFHEFIGDQWTVLFSHPADFTPVRIEPLQSKPLANIQLHLGVYYRVGRFRSSSG